MYISNLCVTLLGVCVCVCVCLQCNTAVILSSYDDWSCDPDKSYPTTKQEDHTHN